MRKKPPVNRGFTGPVTGSHYRRTDKYRGLPQKMIRYSQHGDGLIVVVQHIKKFVTSDIIIGVLAIGIKSNNRWFIIDKYEAKNNQDKTEHELNYLLDATNHFCLRAKALGAVEVQGDMNSEPSNGGLATYDDDNAF
ncbi:unnamed protein product [Rotaria magnacalcarata]|uniref:Uncharacterized protein n=1 Tax=Rotaria magnacalcarata TaxID=392030 RepID=A0A8S2IXU7_9BILA|nr:unnamed protein product [Rotaria magnacalcarata]CAF3822890.1 unnamed protein product [Rotaria magnacalcarata]